MDRNIVYPASIPQEVDILNINKNAMIGLSKLAAAVMGTSTLLNGLACTPNSPAALNVLVGPGEIYALANIDGTAYGSLAADTSHSILKQGISLDTVTLSCPAPSTSGYSVNYLVQVAYQDVDANPVVLPYYNASNPAQAYSGPNNSGVAQNTTRKGVCTVAVKAGVAATTGTQTTPAPDAGYTGVYVVTVANAQTTVTSGNISTYPGAPFINSTLLGLNPAFTVSPTAPTPAQFDISTKVATTSFTQRALGNLSGVTAINSVTTLTAANAGQLISLYGTGGFTLTLPLGSAMPVGGVIQLFGNLTSGNVAVVRQGTDVISVASNTVTGLTLFSGSSLILVWNGASWTAWGESQLPYSPLFTASFAGNGYQKLPSGLIVQWGVVTTSGTPGAATAITFPIAFPNAVYSFTGTPASSGTSVCSAWIDTLAAAGANVHCNIASTPVTWIALGH
ncbi:MAG: gp53-like domain-containing protein [Methylobacter sp.]